MVLSNALKNAIITCCDSCYGDFLADHWLKSLRENVDTSNTEIVIIDYGLTDQQRSKLTGVSVLKAEKKYRIVIQRFHDIERFLEHRLYDQVMIIDGGDVIFQADISDVFGRDADEIRVAVEEYFLDFRTFLLKRTFDKKDRSDIERVTQSRNMINAGVILGPSSKIRQLCGNIYALVLDKNAFGPDQVALNYLLYKEGFKQLDGGYNFIPVTRKRKFLIREGIFYYPNLEIIPLVHNAGNKSMFRTIRNFGFGPDCNEVKVFQFLLLRAVYRLSRFLIR